MGSGETAPTMVKVHRSITEQLLPDTSDAKVHAYLLDTPFGFQTNAEEIATRAASYFRESVGAALEVAGLRSSSDLEGERGEHIVTRMAELPLVFAGPGSPSYALRQWRGTLVPPLLAEKLTLGGAVTFASAAALTLGSATVPVYEIYKVGEDPHWLEGLDLLGPLGLPAVVIPHYDNAEGQTHDTRYCYLGEERLSLMELELASSSFVLGVDEHTALCIDFESRSASVVGHGGVTVRVRGRSGRFEAGETVALDQLIEMAEQLAGGGRGGPALYEGPDAAVGADRDRAPEPAAAVTDPRGGEDEGRTPGMQHTPAGSPLLQAIRVQESEFRVARDARDAPGMIQAILALEQELWDWRADTLQSDEMDRGRASLRSMIAEIGRFSEVGTRDPAEIIAPYVDVAIALRNSARTERRFAEADEVRERLSMLGVEIHDSPEGSTWELQRARSAN